MGIKGIKSIIAYVMVFVVVLSSFPLMGLTKVKEVYAADDDFVIKDGVLIDYYGTDTEVVIPSCVTSIGNGAFEGCSGLTSIIIHEGVSSIGGAFDNCSSLTSICVSENNQKYCSVDGILYTKYKTDLIKCPEGMKGDIVIPDGVIRIYKYAFNNCGNLTSITIPDGVTTIEEILFSGCGSLKSINVLESNQKYCSIDGVLYSKDKTELYLCPPGMIGSMIIPDGVTSIGDYAFRGCSGLTSITIPDGVTSIGDGAFCGCSGLTSITIPDGVTSIGDIETFSDCSGLMSIIIPEGVTNIGHYAFGGCSSLTNIVIPESVTYIEHYAFAGCSSLTSIIIPKGVIEVSYDAFEDCNSLKDATILGDITSLHFLRYCSGLVNIYISESNSNYCSIDGIPYSKDRTGLAFCPLGRQGEVVIPKGVTDLGGGFIYCTSLTSVTIPEGVTDLGGGFTDCTSLISVTIPEGVTNIEGFTFENCRSLASIKISESVTTIERYAFVGCSSLTNIAIPKGVMSIGHEVFTGCSSLMNISVAEDNPNYRSEDGVLYNKNKTELIAFPSGKEGEYFISENIISVGDAFIENSLSGINVSEDNINYSSIDGVLYNKNKTELIVYPGERKGDFVVPDGVTTIRYGAFCKCSGLTSITIPDSITDIEESFTWGVNIVVYGKSGSCAEDYCKYHDNLTFIAIEMPTHTPGDINGDGSVNNKDVTRLRQYLAGWSVEVNEEALDVNGDGSVNNKDVTRLRQYLAGWNVAIY